VLLGDTTDVIIACPFRINVAIEFFGKRSGNKNGKSTKSSVPEGGEQEDKSSSPWKEPSTKIDLAKAYIAMGDAERARSILDEVLEEWDSRDGTQG